MSVIVSTLQDLCYFSSKDSTTQSVGMNYQERQAAEDREFAEFWKAERVSTAAASIASDAAAKVKETSLIESVESNRKDFARTITGSSHLIAIMTND